MKDLVGVWPFLGGLLIIVVVNFWGGCYCYCGLFGGFLVLIILFVTMFECPYRFLFRCFFVSFCSLFLGRFGFMASTEASAKARAEDPDPPKAGTSPNLMVEKARVAAMPPVEKNEVFSRARPTSTDLSSGMLLGHRFPTPPLGATVGNGTASILRLAYASL